MKKCYNIALLLGCFLLLGGCSNAKEQLGLEKKAPDEFSVIRRAPLEMPPSYGLRPPRPGAPRPQEQATSDQARESVFGAGGGSSGSTGVAESALLQRAGGQYTDPNIRQKIDAETLEVDSSKKPVAERLLGIVRDDKPPATVVDAPKEAERIRQNIEEGKDVTEGETPSIDD